MKNEEISKINEQSLKNEKNENIDKKEILEDSNEVLEAVEINNIIDDPKDFEYVMKNNEGEIFSKDLVENIITFVDQKCGSEIIQDKSSGRHHEIESIIIEIRNNSSNVTSNNGNTKLK